MPVPHSLRSLALVALAASAAALAGAYISQYGFGLHPCTLCYWQRLPHAVVIVLGVVAFWRHTQQPKLAKGLLWLCVCSMLAGAVIAAYHAGVEWQWWQGPTACSGAIEQGMTIEEIRAKLSGAKAVSCSEAPFRILGLSMAGWNGLYSLGIAMLLATGLRGKHGKA
ncbi:MAG: disulfide bond formation protein B [Rickettsiales bacterium]